MCVSLLPLSVVWEQMFFPGHLHGAKVISLARLTEEQL